MLAQRYNDFSVPRLLRETAEIGIPPVDLWAGVVLLGGRPDGTKIGTF
jgi:hypothetical protein